MLEPVLYFPWMLLDLQVVLVVAALSKAGASHEK